MCSAWTPRKEIQVLMPVDEQARHQNHGVESDDREHEAFELDARLVNGHRRPLLVSVHSHAALAATVVCAAWTCPAVMVLFTAANTRVMLSSVTSVPPSQPWM
jgi:hypothetical protein